VVLSLPIKWFSIAAQRAVVEPCLKLLGPGGVLLQMTNAFASPIAIEPLGIAGERIAHVWRNLPPAQVWAYSRLAEANAREKR
jgi:phosphatidylethanolamine/phosphatidyl-N-methylethanolamine N-methyltransferase